MPLKSSRSVWFASEKFCKPVILELHGGIVRFRRRRELLGTA